MPSANCRCFSIPTVTAVTIWTRFLRQPESQASSHALARQSSSPALRWHRSPVEPPLHRVISTASSWQFRQFQKTQIGSFQPNHASRRPATDRRANPNLIELKRSQRDNRALPTLKQPQHQAACQGLHLQTPTKPGRQLPLAESTASGSGLPGSGGRFPPEAPGSSRPAWACPQS